MWEKSDVKPSNQTIFEVDKPLNMVIDARVFDAKIRVTDPLGIAVLGQVSATLVNGTTITGSTDGDGRFVIPMIPVGTFTATISNLGITTKISAEAMVPNIIQTQAPLSYPILGIFLAVLFTVAIAATILSRRKRNTTPTRIDATWVDRP